jgi:type IV pilus assembly protein PilW
MAQIASPTPYAISCMCNLKSNHKTYRTQRGVSLIELMVGLTIGLLVVIGAVGSLVFSQATSTVLADSARLQQKADAIFANIGTHLLQAGAVNIEWNNAGVSFSESYKGLSTTTTGLAGQMMSIHGLEGNTTTPETLRISYQDNMLSTDDAATRLSNGIRDCLGNRPAVEFINIDNEFYLNGSDLMCRGSSAPPNNAQAIADGVEDFQVWYGIQTTAATDNLQYLFYSANNVPDWSSIHAIRLCIVLRGESKGNPTPGLSMKNCNDQAITNDGFIRRIYWRTFGLRNALL